MSLLLHITTVPHTLAFLKGQAAFLRERGFETEVVSSPGSELDRFCAQEGIPGHAVEMTRQVTPFKDLGAVLNLWTLIGRLNPRIVDAHTPKAGLLGMFTAWLHRIPVRIFHLHGLPHLTSK